jgi:hypothetical protein
MRNHTTPKYHELVSQQGKNPTFAFGPNAVPIQFLMNGLPTSKDGSFWYYLNSIILKVTASIQPDELDLNNNTLKNLVQSLQIQCPILGQLFTHQNTRGTVLGNLIEYLGYGYNQLPTFEVPAGARVVTVYYRIPFSYEFLRKPHETSPWTGFLEGGTAEVRFSPTPLPGDGGNTVMTVGDCRMYMEMFPSPEAVIHTPCNWREHTTPGGSTKHVITDMGSPDGLQGIDQSKGCGIAGLWGLSSLAGLGGSQLWNNVLSYDIPWRDQDRVDIPDAMLVSLVAQMGNNRKARNFTSPTLDDFSFPWLNDSAGTYLGNLLNTELMVMPFIAPGRDQETSKLQTVAGAKELNFQYTATPANPSLWVGHYFPQFDEQFAKSLAARIAPNADASELTAKTLNKNQGVNQVGKLAYTRQKIDLTKAG